MMNFNEAPVRILFTALDWGLGHTTRIVPIIRMVQILGMKVVFAGTEKQISFLKSMASEIETETIPGLRIRLSAGNSQTGILIRQAPGLLLQVRREHRMIHQLATKHKVSFIISDNVYGAFSKEIPSVIITHQLEVLLPRPVTIARWLISRLLRYWLERFSEIWVPDYPGKENLTGSLSEPGRKMQKTKFIGLMSRFTGMEIPSIQKIPGRVLVILSGPEPQRSILENIVRDQFSECEKELDLHVIRGLPGMIESDRQGWFNHLQDDDFIHEVSEAEFIICRSGYSTLMDLIALKRTAFLVPTPGQTEQEYLAAYLSDRKYFAYTEQSNFSFSEAISVMREMVSRKFALDVDHDRENLRKLLIEWQNRFIGNKTTGS